MLNHTTRLRLVSAAATAAALAGPAVANAAGTYLPSRTISAPGLDNLYPRAIFDADGGLTAIWSRSTCTYSFGGISCDDPRIEATRRPFGGDFGAVQEFDQAGEISGYASPPVAGANQAGAATVAWVGESGGGTERLHVTARDAGGSFSALVTPFEPAWRQSSPAVAVSSDGTSIVAWHAASKDKVPVHQIHYVVRAPGASFGSVHSVPSSVPDVDGVEVAFRPQGGALLAWTDAKLGQPATIRTATAPPGPNPTFGAATGIVGVTDPFSLALAMGGDGRAVLAYVSVINGPSQVIKTVVEGPNGGFPSPTAVSGDSGSYASPPVATTDGNGRVVIVWGRDDGNGALKYVTKAPGGPISDAGTVPGSTSGNPTGPSLASGDDGSVLLAFQNHTGQDFRVRAAAMTGDSFAPAQTVGSATDDAVTPTAAIDPEGNAAIVYTTSTAIGDEPLLVVPFDAAGPHLSGVSGLSAATAGSPVSGFGATAVDQWSTVSTAFAFGDGATGNAPHTFAAPGTYKPTVTATDALGHATTAGLPEVAVAAAPAGPGAGPSGPGTVPPGGGKPGVDRIAPVLSAASLSRPVFRTSAKATARVARRSTVKPGTLVRFRLSETATVKLRIERVARHAKARTVATLTRSRQTAGRRSIAFSGRIGRKALKPGAYRIVIAARDAAGNVSKSRTLRFRIA